MLGTGKSLVLASLLSVAACGEQGRSPDFFVQGTGVVVASAAPFTKHSDFPTRIENTLDAALTYWGGSWKNLEGSTITLEDAQYVHCGGSTDAIGCDDGNIRVSTRDPSLGTWYCVEETVLVHEVGHAVIGDPNHTDPRWMDFVPVQEQLDGKTGYADTGEVPCQLFLSVWRHVLASP
jgi:hypothetical protein